MISYGNKYRWLNIAIEFVCSIVRRKKTLLSSHSIFRHTNQLPIEVWCFREMFCIFAMFFFKSYDEIGWILLVAANVLQNLLCLRLKMRNNVTKKYQLWHACCKDLAWFSLRCLVWMPEKENNRNEQTVWQDIVCGFAMEFRYGHF